MWSPSRQRRRETLDLRMPTSYEGDGSRRCRGTVETARGIARGLEDAARLRPGNQQRGVPDEPGLYPVDPLQRGSCLLRASVDGVVRAGVVAAPSVRWAKLSGDRHNVNVLTSERLTDFGGGATFYSCLVQVEQSGD